jgi:hypothetical protein
MNAAIEFISAWKDLITKVFSDSPLAGAIVSVLAICAFFALERQYRPNKAPTNIAIVVIGWAILVPVTGFVMKVLGLIWDFLAATFPILRDLLASFYGIYTRHPLLVLAIVVCSVIGFFVWQRFWPRRIPNRLYRGVLLVVGAVVVAHIASPIADLISPAAGKNGSSEQQKAEK